MVPIVWMDILKFAMLTGPVQRSMIPHVTQLLVAIIRFWRIPEAVSGMPFVVKLLLIGNLCLRTVKLSMMTASSAQSVWKPSDTNRHLPGLQSLRSEPISTVNPLEENNKPKTAMVVIDAIMAVSHFPRNTGGECHGRTC